MKLLIAGSRSIKEINLSEYITRDVKLIITGGAGGVDTIAEDYARANKISRLILLPEYSLYKKAAPLKRNEQMVDIADKVLIFWDGKSNGSKYTINYAKKKCKDLEIVLIN